MEDDNSDANDVPVKGNNNNNSKSMGVLGIKAQNTIAQRLASFAIVHSRKRPSSTKGAKTAKLQWPSENPSPLAMAEAGFYYKPTIKSQDNVVCYLCQKNLDGWEPEDDPRIEHLSHSDDCGWAWNMCTKLDRKKAPLDSNPSDEKMVDARRMTYSVKWWPHENKKGWRAKIENLVDAGFIYSPSPEADDRVCCPYCEVAVENWEPKDGPREIHKQRAPTCPFITYGEAPSEATQVDEQVEQLASKTTKAKKGKGRKPSTAPTSKLRKAAASELDPDDYQEMVMRGGSYDEETIETIPKSALKGRKRSSAVMEAESKKPLFTQEGINAKLLERQQQYQSDMENARVPPAKRRNTRASMVAKSSDLQLDGLVSVPAHMQMSDDEANAAMRSYMSPEKPKARKSSKRVSTASDVNRIAKKRRSTRNSTVAPVVVPDMDDEEIDRALEEDLLRPLSDEEVELDLDINILKNAVLSPISSPMLESPLKKGKRRLTKTRPPRMSTACVVADSIPELAARRTRASSISAVSKPTVTRKRDSHIVSPPVSPAQSNTNEAVQEAKSEVIGKRPVKRGRKPSVLKSRAAAEPEKEMREPEIVQKKRSVKNGEKQSIPRAAALSGYDSGEESELSILEITDKTTEAAVKGKKKSALKAVSAAESAPAPAYKSAPKLELKVEEIERAAMDVVKAQPTKKGTNAKKQAMEYEDIKITAVEAPLDVQKTWKHTSEGTQQEAVNAGDIMVDSLTGGFTEDDFLANGDGGASANDEPILPKKGRKIAPKKTKKTIKKAPEASATEPVVLPTVSATPQKHTPRALSLPLDEEEAPAAEESTFVDQAPMSRYYESLQLNTFEIAGDNNEDEVEETIDAILDTYHHDQEPEEATRENSPTTFAKPAMPASFRKVNRQASFGSSVDTIPNTQLSGSNDYQSTRASTFTASKKGVSFAATADHQLQAEQEASFQINEESQRDEEMEDENLSQALSPIMRPLVNNAVSLVSTPRREDQDASKTMVSMKPWHAVELDVVFHNLEQSKQAISSELIMAEMNLTVADWIKINAVNTEKRLLRDCERIVEAFESEGRRALECLAAVEV